MNALRLLVIDRDPALQRAVETALGAEGYEVTGVDDGLTALDVALAAAPDVILADYRMEGINVFRFLEKLKQKNALKNVALLLMINPGDVYDELTLRLVGVTDFLRKPLNAKEAVERIKRYSPVATPAVPAAPAVAKTAEPEPAKIEDLLGWSREAAPSPFSELSQDRSSGFDFSLTATESSSGILDAPQFVDRTEDTPTDHPIPGSETEQAFADLQETSLSDRTRAAEPLFGDPTEFQATGEAAAPVPNPKPQAGADANGSTVPVPELVARAARDAARDVVEKVAWELVPDLAKQSLDRVVHAVVERIVWDVVPQIAEAAIKKEIERLTQENG